MSGVEEIEAEEGKQQETSGMTETFIYRTDEGEKREKVRRGEKRHEGESEANSIQEGLEWW